MKKGQKKRRSVILRRVLALLLAHERSPDRFQEAVNCLQKRRAHGKKSSYEYEISKMYEEMRRNE